MVHHRRANNLSNVRDNAKKGNAPHKRYTNSSEYRTFMRAVNEWRQKRGLAPTSDPEYFFRVGRNFVSAARQRADFHHNKIAKKMAKLAGRSKKLIEHEASKHRDRW